MSKFNIGDKVIIYVQYDTRVVFYEGKILGIFIENKKSYKIGYKQAKHFKLDTQTSVDENCVFPYKKINLEKLNKKAENLNTEILKEVEELNKNISDKFQKALNEIIFKQKLKEKDE